MRGRWDTVLGCGAVCVAVAYFLRHARFWSSTLAGGHDWDAQTFYLESIVRTVTAYGSFPSWNPWYLGGMPVFGNPQVKVLSPTFWLALPLGATEALRISVVLYYFIGSLGAVFLFRGVLGLRWPAAFLGSCLISFTSYLPLHLYAGHMVFIGVTLLPWMLGFAVWAVRDHGEARARHAMAAGGVGAVVVFEAGAAHVLLPVLAGGGVLALFYCIQQRRAGPMLAYLGAVICCALLSACALVPQVVYLLEHGAQRFPDSTALSLPQLVSLFVRPVSVPEAHMWVGQRYSWWEYGNYTGILPIVMLLLLLPWLRRSDWPILAIVTLILLLTLGRFAEISPAALLGRLPIFEHQRAFARWSVLATFGSGVLLALWFDRALAAADGSRPARQSRHWRLVGRTLSFVPALLLFYQLQIVNAKLFRGFFTLNLPQMPAVEEIETIRAGPAYGASSAMLPALRAGNAIRDGYEILNVPRAARARDEPTYKGEFYLEGSGKAVRPEHWTPGSIRFRLTLTKFERLVLNQNYYRGWRTDAGLRVENAGGLVSVLLPAGEHSFRLYYRDGLTFALLWFCLGAWCAGALFLFLAAKKS